MAKKIVIRTPLTKEEKQQRGEDIFNSCAKLVYNNGITTRTSYANQQKVIIWREYDYHGLKIFFEDYRSPLTRDGSCRIRIEKNGRMLFHAHGLYRAHGNFMERAYSVAIERYRPGGNWEKSIPTFPPLQMTLKRQ